ncbi:MAG: serine/threonine-protein kinase, partial [Planctomycetota bacterium]
HAVGEEDGHHFIAFEKIDGPTLGQAIAQLKALGRRPTAADLARVTGHAPCAEAESYYEACARLMQGVFDGVQAAHEAGVIHRDLKPSNILLDEAGKPLVADFGLAKDSDDLGLSMTGEALGTPHYMSPEQAIAAGNARIDARTDVYSLGVTLYELLALERPFEGASFSELMRNIIDQSPHPLAEKLPDLPRAVEDVVLKSMAKEPDLRYGSVPDLAQDFDRAVRGEGVEAESQVGLTALFQGLARAERTKSPFEYKSRKTLFGLPWIHVILRKRDPETGKAPWAKGVLAFGPRAIGLYAGGGIAIGGLAFGLVSVGLISIGVIALGLQAAGGAAVGYEAQGLIVLAVYGQALMDGTALHLMSGERQDAEAVERFQTTESSQASNLFFGGVLFCWTMLYAGFKEKAKTPRDKRNVFVMIRIVLPALYALPWVLVALGHKLSFPVELAIFVAVTAGVSYAVKRLLERSGKALQV